MKSYYIHLIRNGLTQANLDGRYIGHTDEPLCEEGMRALEKLRNEYAYPPVDALLSSPLCRCTQTARILYPEKEPLVIDGLIEYNFGEFEGKTAQELQSYPMFPGWLAGEPDAQPPFGESARAFSSRLTGCFKKIAEGLMKTGTTRVAIVTHGGVIAALLTAFGIPEAPMHEWLTPSGCGYTLRITPSLWMRGNKFEVIAEIPTEPAQIPDEEDLP